MSIGILAVQGAFIEHAHCLEQLSQDYVLLRKKSDIPQNLERLILPGGESTVQRKLLHELDLFSILKNKILEDMPVLGTCVGLILLAEQIAEESTDGFQSLPVLVRRNAYGRQLGSFSTKGTVGEISDFPMRFIRAPYIEKILHPDVQILNLTDQHITAVNYKNQIGTAFHPELTDDLRIHKLFLSL